ncbi:hypothetical protein O3M35_012681 [Rhynocoris fuscipes]|uniref:DOMON domain-containing protein n=1 Tax=Rhynocoris fuscipes TaxID=488301 RepID=A0AAW1CT85_9HEMI
MSFGLSGDDRKSAMVGGDVVTAWVDQNTLNGYAHDYYLDSKSQCAGTRGSCPDYRIEPNTESVRLLNAALVNGYSIVTYQRPLKAHDGLDKPIFTNRSQPIIWAVGPLNSKLEVSYHSITSKGDVFLDFGRPPKWNCPIPESDATPDASSSANLNNGFFFGLQRATEPPAPVYKTPPPPAPAPKNSAWEIPPIQCNEPEDGVFYAQMGPTGGKHGYPAITGHVGWGISYYINGLLIPEIYVVRGRTYTFVVEGGKDPNIPAKYHPFYITDDPVGGYQHKTPEEKRKVNIYAGAELNKHGEVVPTGLGRLCNWTPDPDQPMADEFASFGAYQRTLTLVCDHGEPAVVQWTPDKDTPDTVYYQCFLHRYLGWKIHVLDRCDLPPDRNAAGSAPVPSVLLPEGQQQDELQAKPSIIVTTRVKPDFPSQSLTDTAFKNYTKMHFPYEILKPAYNVKRPNLSDEHIIPVKEDVEDIPDTSSTQKPNQSMNTTLNGATALPLIKGPQPHRNGYGNTGNMRLPTRRPVIMVRRPLQPMMKPHMNQHIPHMNRPMAFGAPSQNRPVIVKKPIMRLPQRPMMMQNLPARPMMPQQPSVMPNRAPVKAVYVHKFKKPIQQSFNTPLPEKTKFKMQPSQMISQSAEEITTRLPIAVNTGFNPGSLVIESGFKPIIQTPHAEDRLSEIEYEDSNEGVINVENLDEQKSHTEMFEPMFIPSPLDSNTKHTKKATTEPVKKIRKPYRQVIVRRPIYNDEPLFRSEPEEPIDKLKPYYLPSTRTTPSSSSSSTASDNDDKTSPIPANHKPERKDDLTTDKPVALPLKTDASEEITVDNKETKQEPIAQASDLEIVTVINVFKEERRQRKRRDAHHEPGHNEDNNQHDHSEHDHSQHDHAQHQANNTNNSNQITPFLCLTIFTTILAKFL